MSGRILIVEDEFILADDLEWKLKQLGCEVLGIATRSASLRRKLPLSCCRLHPLNAPHAVVSHEENVITHSAQRAFANAAHAKTNRLNYV